jgi:uncharacterized protein (DUF4415 family)
MRFEWDEAKDLRNLAKHEIGFETASLRRFALSLTGRLHRGKGEPMKTVTKKQAKEIRALSRMPDEKIDLTDLPPGTDWRNAAVGKFYRPIKSSLTIRIDADVLAWLKAHGKGYQTRINGLLREAMQNTGHRR